MKLQSVGAGDRAEIVDRVPLVGVWGQPRGCGAAASADDTQTSAAAAFVAVTLRNPEQSRRRPFCRRGGVSVVFLAHWVLLKPDGRKGASNRRTAAVIHPLRTGSAMTPVRRHPMRSDADPDCHACGECADTGHLLLECAEPDDARAVLGFPCKTKEEPARIKTDE
uniref:Putative non-ltr rnase hi domain of reverse transcriptase n=1 Tax=Ixodes ricinus TaxID=34613 RepID=A0A6B0UXM3_IXORI